MKPSSGSIYEGLPLPKKGQNKGFVFKEYTIEFCNSLTVMKCSFKYILYRIGITLKYHLK